MSTNAPHTPGEFGEPPARTAPTRSPLYYPRKLLKALASLQLTVVLFALGLGLIFFGTLAQLDHGIWTVVSQYFWSWTVDVPFDLIGKFMNVFWKEQFPDLNPKDYPDGVRWKGTFPFPAGKLLGLLMLVNLLAAHATRFRLTWKRSGVFLIHGGLILLFVGEFITREFAVEQQMTIDEGQSVDFAQDIRSHEYVFVDKSDPKTDSVVVIPEYLLRKGGRITHPDLPVDVEVVDKFMVNATIKPAPKSESGSKRKPVADRGVGADLLVDPVAEVSGLEENERNFPAVYLKFFKKGTDESLGTYLASLEVFLRGGFDKVEIGDKTYQTVLRYRRYYKPYRIHLDKFSFDRYVGTTKARNFSSDVKVYDESGNLVREQRIAMNEPMRYRGETFYQSSFDGRTEKTTFLQIVKNPGWVLPYVSCVVVGLGLTLHFGIYLLQFLRRKQPVRSAASEAGSTPDAPTILPQKSAAVRYFPWVMLGVSVLYLLSVTGRMTPAKEPVDYSAAGAMPLYEGGRAKPLEALARVKLRFISGREEVEDEKGKKVPAIKWYLETLTGGSPQNRGPVWDYKLVRIDNEQVLRELKLENVEGFRYSIAELAPHQKKIFTRGMEATRKAEKKQKLDKTEAKFKELYERFGQFLSLSASGGPQLPPHAYPADIAAKLKETGAFGPDSDPRPDREKWVGVREYRTVAQMETAAAPLRAARAKIAPLAEKLSPDDELLLPPALQERLAKLPPDQRPKFRAELVKFIKEDPTNIDDPELRKAWLDTAVLMLSDADVRAVRGSEATEFARWMAAHPAAQAWEDFIVAYRGGRSADFTKAISDWRAAHAGFVSEKEVSRTRAELVLDRFAPFYQCTGLYVLAAVLTLIGFTQTAAGRPDWAAALRKGALAVLGTAFVLHTIGLFARMYIMDRPMVFVTNLYASAVFIGWGCVGLCLLIERIFPLGIGSLLAASLGLATTIVAHNLAGDDTMEMVVAVLDTNFWLATHVTTITLGYTATFVAGFLGALYVVQVLAAVVRDSFQKTGEPTVGELLAFGVAATGSVAIPLFMLWFLTTALDKFEVLPSFLLWTLFGVVFVVGVLYAIGLMLMKVGMESVDANGRPLPGHMPGLAQPLVSMALTPERGKVFGQMVYGVVCFATLLSFVGTVLGGIWADQSWGRFWGWDPKENGAVLIVLWNSLILHARWAGLVKDRGVAVLAIFGNVITAWSWFGTNQLQAGLHSYGFDTRLADGCFNFWVSQMLILGLGLIPARFWKSSAKSVAAPASTAVVSASLPVTAHAPTASAPAAPAPAASAPHANGNGHSKRDKKKHGKRR